MASTYSEVEGIENLSSDHTTVLMTVSTTVIRKKRKPTLINKHTDRKVFRDKLDKLINLRIRLRSIEKLEQHAREFINNLQEAAKQARPQLQEMLENEVSYLLEVRELIKKRRRTRRI